MNTVVASFLCVLFLLLPNFGPTSRGYTTGKRADMSAYETLPDKDHVFVTASVDDVQQAMDRGETFALFLGYSHCPWCREAVPILNEVAKEYKTDVLYVNVRPNPEQTKNTQMPDYDKLCSFLGSYFEKDEETGQPTLYVPFVFFIRDGQVVKYHQGTVEGHDAWKEKMTGQQQDALRNIYRDGFNQIFMADT